MARLRITIIQGHPDARGRHFGRALADAYAKGAADSRYEVKRIDVARIDFPVLRTREEWERGPVPDSIRQAQETIAWAEHIVLVFPLWLGTMPALLKAFLKQVFRPGFAWEGRRAGGGCRQTR